VNAAIAVLSALAVGLAARAAMRAVERSIAAYRARYHVASAGAFLASLPHLGPADVRRLSVAACIGAGAVGALLGGAPAALALAGAGAALPRAAVSFVRGRWLRRLESQLVDALETTAAALQAGLSLLQALEAAAAASDAPLREELGLALREIRLGADPDEALDALATRVPSEELALFVAGTALARRTGGNLAASYRAVADALRERFRVEGKLRALTAQGRLQGWIVGALPLGLAFVVHRMRPDLVEPMLAHPFGWGLVLAVAGLEIAGFFWIRRIVTPTF